MSSDDPLLVVRGRPSDEELAAVVVAFLLSRRQARVAGRPPARRPFWIAGPVHHRGPSTTVPSQTARRG
ncbi:acyl-CoA carboxylase subunit epsilon [Streptosporangium saharense]|uniref:acyl-CoA carboxylase subunit epsilon n=1 Tax=Streptosporangium saharense TaxID=1706840 RepID=UPI003316D7AC